MRTAVLFSLVCAAFLCAAPCYAGGKPEKKHAGQTSETPPPETGLRIGAGRGFVFVGVSARLSKREDAVKAALEDAARKLSFFYLVSGNAVRREHIGGQAMDFYIEKEYQLQYDEELEQFLGQLEYDSATDIFEINNAVFVVARAAPSVSMPPFRGHYFGKERPAWVDAPPAEINGFAAGVGYSARMSSHCDAVIKSYEQAVLEIIENMGSQVSGEQQGYQNSYSVFGFEMTTDSKTTAYGVLKNFYVIECWTDPANLSVWTLAVAKQSEQ